MSNEPKPQDVQDEPRPTVTPMDELGDEELDKVAGGIIINFQPAPTAAPTVPQISPKLNYADKQ